MDRMKRILNEYLNFYESALGTLEKRKTPMFKERLLIQPRHHHVEYYTKKKDPSTHEFKRTYLRKEQIWLAKAIAQGDYEKELKKKLAVMIDLMSALNEHYPDNGIEDVYFALRPGRQALVDPILPIRKQKLEEWMRSGSSSHRIFDGSIFWERFFFEEI